MRLIHQHESPYWTRRLTDTFDQLYEESAERAKILTIAVHPYISAMPHRFRYLKAAYAYFNRFEGVLHWNVTEILNWYERQNPG
jgi:allantoinase